jgi:hypothetical protein
LRGGAQAGDQLFPGGAGGGLRQGAEARCGRAGHNKAHPMCTSVFLL